MAEKKVMNIYETITAVMNEIGAVGKNSKNQQQGFMFRGIDAVMNALNPAMKKFGLFVVPEILEQTREERTTQKGGLLIYSICRIKYTFYAQDGSNISAIVVGEGMDSGDKATNKAMSIAFKYACFQVFCIPTEEMCDPDAEVHDPAPKNTPSKNDMKDTEKQYIDEKKQKALEQRCKSKGVTPVELLDKCHLKSLAEVTEKQFYWLSHDENWEKLMNGN